MCISVHVHVGVEGIGDGGMEDRVWRAHSQTIDLGVGGVSCMCWHASVHVLAWPSISI